MEAFESTEEQDEDIRVHLGAKGLVLQFTEKAIPHHEGDWLQDELECQVYLVPESLLATKEWMTHLNYVASIFDEMREWHPHDTDEPMEVDGFDHDSVASQSESHVPLRLLW